MGKHAGDRHSRERVERAPLRTSAARAIEQEGYALGPGPRDQRSLLATQRAAGNRAVSEMLAGEGHGRSASRALAIQRHSSWEHALLGDTPPGQLAGAAVSRRAKGHILSEQWARMMFFKDSARGDPRSRFPDIRWIQLRASELWVSYGELNALGDYLPDPTASDTLPAATLIPVIQRMRSGIRAKTGEFFGLHGKHMAGMATSGLDLVHEAGGEVSALDDATASLGSNRYLGLVARNACHFAPFSWQRWALFHNEAREEALMHHRSGAEQVPIGSVDTNASEHLRQAWLKNGYGDHFLQDSFAAGHLVNKTLVMQWFAQYVAQLNWFERPWFGAPSARVLSVASEGSIAGQHLYGRTPGSESSADDRAAGFSPADPQTAMERSDRERRVAGSGVGGRGAEREQRYQAYLAFMNNAFMQSAAGAVHDWFNERGLLVQNAHDDQFQVGGDDTLLTKSGPLGAELAGRAAHMSQQAIQDLLGHGQTSVTVDKIFELFPQFIMEPKGAPGKQTYEKKSLAEWHDNELFRLCWNTIFPEVEDSIGKGLIASRVYSPEMVAGGISPDAGRRPPRERRSPMGDYPAPSGSRRRA